MTPTALQRIKEIDWGIIYRILVDNAGAPADKDDWENFENSMKSGNVDEYRFQGLLGFGGKFWLRRFQVDCYTEDLNKRRMNIIEKTNMELAKLQSK